MNTTSSVAAPVARPGKALTPARWIAATFLGWTLGFLLAILLIVGVESVGVRHTQFPLALGMGIGVGFVQARFLYRYLGARWPWLGATALGLAAPFIVMDISRAVGAPLPYSLAIFVALGGVCASIFQWRLLSKITERASLWLLASPVGWVLGGSMVWISERLPRIPSLVGAPLYVGTILGGGIVLGACTARVLREPRSD